MTEPFISINELSKRLAIPAHTLRYWEKTFDGEIRPVTGAGGRRYYRESDAAKIAAIRDLLHNKKYTIAGVKKLLDDGDITTANNVGARWTHPAQSSIAPGPGGNAPLQPSDINVVLDLLRRAKEELKDS